MQGPMAFDAELRPVRAWSVQCKYALCGALGSAAAAVAFKLLGGRRPQTDTTQKAGALSSTQSCWSTAPAQQSGAASLQLPCTTHYETSSSWADLAAHAAVHGCSLHSSNLPNVGPQACLDLAAWKCRPPLLCSLSQHMGRSRPLLSTDVVP